MTTGEKITIKNKNEEGIVGILVKKTELDIAEQKPRIVLICHGVLGHKDYLFFKLLAQELPFTSFRFDFRGNGESEGSPGYANIQEDTDDIAVVADYFEKQGYQIYTIIGHSRGAVSSLKYATSCEKPVPHVVNCSGRFKMDDNQIYKNRPEIGESLDRQGYFDWAVKQRDRICTIQVTRKDVDKFCAWDNSHVKYMPLSTCVLTVHGSNDNIVPVYNAAFYANAIPNHTLELIHGADHNFKGHFEEIVKAIIDHLMKHEKDSYEKATSMHHPYSVTLPRWIDVPNVQNFRDLGGYPTKDGLGYIRERTIFRSAHLGSINEEGIKILQQLNVSAVFDFRSDPEIEVYGNLPEVEGIDYHRSDMYKSIDTSPANMASHWKAYFEGPEGIARAYSHTLEVAKVQYGNIFLYILNNFTRESRKSLLVHCTAGKDRTGLYCALLLGLCGIDDEIIAREYALTNIGFWISDEEITFRANKVNCTFEQMKEATSAPYPAMKILLKQLKEKYGSIEGYIQKECGLSQDQCNRLREILIVPINFDQKQFYRK
ncbi:unnamed protein product [Cunninghamella blakesleeana]